MWSFMCTKYLVAYSHVLFVCLWQVGVPVYKEGNEVKPSQIAKNGLEEAKRKKIDVVIMDTAGRLQVLLQHSLSGFLFCFI